jgi:hypothetical protein
MDLGYSCDGVPLKFKKKNRRAFSLPVTDYFEHTVVLAPRRIRWRVPLKNLLLVSSSSSSYCH